MASPATPTAPSGGVSTSMWAGQPTNPRSTHGPKTNDSGSSFRGQSRGRPGGRGGGSRGGRGGRGGSARGGAPSSESKPPKSPIDQPKEKAPKPSAGASKPITVPPPAEKPSAAPKPAPTAASQVNGSSRPTTKPKPTVRKPVDQKVPAPRKASIASSLPPPSSTSTTASPIALVPPHPLSRPASRRRRSQATNPPPAPSAASVAVSSSSATTNGSKVPRSRKSSVSVKGSAIIKDSKDLPPHLVPPPPSEAPSFDIKHDIDALVERVRAVAMDRPNTPGSHIDWAGEDDDSLPDLDDWGVPASKIQSMVAANQDTESLRASVISPILGDTLKPLPTLADHDLSTPSPIASDAIDDASEALRRSEADSLAAVPPETTPIASEVLATTSTAKEGPSETPQVSEVATVQSAIESVPGTSAGKPTETSNRASSRSPKKAVGLSSLPPKPTFDKRQNGRRFRDPAPVSVPPAINIVHDNGVSTSVHASSNGSASGASSTKGSSPERGLSTSMHAVIASQSAPSDITSHTLPSTPRGNGSFTPTHNRAHTHTAGKLPHSANAGNFSDHHSDNDRPGRGHYQNHLRTHSTPPAGPGHHGRVHHASRPIISGGAMSMLARTLAGGSPSKRDSAQNAPLTTTPAKP